MFQNKKNWRKILLPVCCLGILFFGMGGWKFQSVDSYKEEQKNLQQEENTTGVESEAEEQAQQQEQGSNHASLPDGKTRLANGGELVTPSVSQVTDAAENQPLRGDSQSEGEDGAGTGTVPGASETDSSEGGASGQSGVASEKSREDSGGTNANSPFTPVPVNPSVPAGEKEDIGSGNQGDNGKTENIYNPQRTPSPVKEPMEGMVTGTITIDCTSILDNMEALDGNLHGFVPSSGYIVKGQSFRLKEGANAYMALQTVCKELDIQLDASYTPLYNSYYIKGIGYLYEKSAGRKSGWLYRVNGEIPKVGVSAYTLKEGDQITFMYTCNGGNDVR